ncbi:DNA-processing protein DprA [Peptoniphilus catoniae]|uniref:DNA-processing protein DprA n=1 Tax=Peptoniphilus catoniae TaxID=1660341 RepID=UPI0010FE3E71|nr:DNA-processing protein DprA [Peptoniphilus catoniae]
MNYNEFLLNLNFLNFENIQIERLEKTLLSLEVSYEDFLDKYERYEDKISPGIIKMLKNYKYSIADKAYEYCEKKDIKIYFQDDPLYPKYLLNIDDSPKLIYVKGDIAKTWDVGVAIVGARKHSDYGRVVVDSIVDYLSDYNVAIISGMAYGIDAVSHMRAIKNNIKTIGVLGNGVDVVYPLKNKDIYNKILEYGAIVSEYHPGSKAMPYRFPLRNRIISGLSDIVIVAEARKRSGSLITGRIAAEQGKEVFAVPGNINSIYSEGTNKLIADGASILTEINDLSIYLPSKNKSTSILDESNLGNDELKILREIENGTEDINLISINLKEDIATVNSILTILEMKDLVEISGQKVALKVKIL